MLRSVSLALVVALAIAVASTATRAENLDQRLETVGKTIDAADDMFRGAMKGHLPSLEVINALRARMSLAKALYKDARAEAAGGDADKAGADLDAAEFLAQKVYEAAKH